MNKLLSLLSAVAVASALLAASQPAAATAPRGLADVVVGDTTPLGGPKPSPESRLPSRSATAEVAIMAGGYTHYWGSLSGGCWNLYLEIGLSARHPVTASASEVINGVEWMGSATITVHNVRVISGGVQIRLCHNWGSPIHVNVHYVWG